MKSQLLIMIEGPYVFNTQIKNEPMTFSLPVQRPLSQKWIHIMHKLVCDIECDRRLKKNNRKANMSTGKEKGVNCQFYSGFIHV